MTDVTADWLAQFGPDGRMPTQSDLVEAFVQMAHIQHIDGMRALMEEDYYEYGPKTFLPGAEAVGHQYVGGD